MVALLMESVDGNATPQVIAALNVEVALLMESVDGNLLVWLIPIAYISRSPHGERGLKSSEG